MLVRPTKNDNLVPRVSHLPAREEERPWERGRENDLGLKKQTFEVFVLKYFSLVRKPAGDTPGDLIRRSQRICSQAIFTTDGHTWRFFSPTLFPGSIEGHFEKSCDTIAHPDCLTLLATRSNQRRKSRKRAHLAFAYAGEFNHMPDIGDFIRRLRRSAKIVIASPGTPDDRQAKCVAGFPQTLFGLVTHSSPALSLAGPVKYSSPSKFVEEESVTSPRDIYPDAKNSQNLFLIYRLQACVVGNHKRLILIPSTRKVM